MVTFDGKQFGNIEEMFKGGSKDNLMKVSEVAELLNCSPSTVYNWAETGKLNSVKINGLVRFSKSDILQAINK